MVNAMTKETDFSETLEAILRDKIHKCRRILSRSGSGVVAFSGGVDSTFLLAIALETLGRDNVVAATGVSPIHPEKELRAARDTAAGCGVELVEIKTDEMADEAFTSNPPRKCYYCKKGLFTRLKTLAAERGMEAVFSGDNADDVGDFRPGMEAEDELGIVRPLLEAGLTKADIRAASAAMEQPTAEKPASACLASRIPYGSEITTGKLSRIDKAETALGELGFENCRVRDHEPIARIEVPPDDLPRALAYARQITDALKPLGYTYITLDLQGLRSGSMNETLS